MDPRVKPVPLRDGRSPPAASAASTAQRSLKAALWPQLGLGGTFGLTPLPPDEEREQRKRDKEEHKRAKERADLEKHLNTGLEVEKALEAAAHC